MEPNGFGQLLQILGELIREEGSLGVIVQLIAILIGLLVPAIQGQ